MAQSEIERKIRRIEERSPIKLDDAVRFDLESLSTVELDGVEAIVSYSGSRMGSSLYCVNYEGELVEKHWPLSSPLRKKELRPVRDHLLEPLIGAGFMGLIALAGSHDYEYTFGFAGIGAVGGLIGSLIGYFNDSTVKKRFKKYLEQRTEK